MKKSNIQIGDSVDWQGERYNVEWKFKKTKELYLSFPKKTDRIVQLNEVKKIQDGTT